MSTASAMINATEVAVSPMTTKTLFKCILSGILRSVGMLLDPPFPGATNRS